VNILRNVWLEFWTSVSDRFGGSSPYLRAQTASPSSFLPCVFRLPDATHLPSLVSKIKKHWIYTSIRKPKLVANWSASPCSSVHHLNAGHYTFFRILYKHDVSETRFYFHHQVEPTWVSPINIAGHCLRRQKLVLSIRPICVGSTWRRKHNAASVK
jgi:hypothetical protein